MKLTEYFRIQEDLKSDLNGEYQKLIRDHIISQANEELEKKIIASGKNIPDCFNFVLREVEKEYIEKNGRTTGGYACSDGHVYSIAMHYFDENSIVKEAIKPNKKVEKKETIMPKEDKKTKVKKPSKEELFEEKFGGMTLFG